MNNWNPLWSKAMNPGMKITKTCILIFSILSGHIMAHDVRITLTTSFHQCAVPLDPILIAYSPGEDVYTNV
jgi:hypothetical protein